MVPGAEVLDEITWRALREVDDVHLIAAYSPSRHAINPIGPAR